MLNHEQAKEIALSLGAHLVGIAPAHRFHDAPPGFRPSDIYDKCRSVVVIAKRVPTTVLHINSCVPYTHVSNVLTYEVDRMSIELSLRLEAEGAGAVALPSDDPYDHWESERMYGRALLSMRHAGYLAGLGVLGRNTLLLNKDYGNMLQIGAVLTNAELQGDALATYEVCPEGCRLCLDACPQGALDGETANQMLCRPLELITNEKGYVLKRCYECRRACPHYMGC